MGWPLDQPFFIPPEVAEFFAKAMERGKQKHRDWHERMEKHPAEAELLHRFYSYGKVSLDGPSFDSAKPLATRAAMGELFEEIGKKVPNFFGGAADLVESTKTVMKDFGDKYNLVLENVETFRLSYARTLKLWRERFLERWPMIAPLGYDEEFKRKWVYYLSYCEAGFTEGSIDVGIYQYRKPA